jgi:perosamine synthetase
VTSAVSLFNGCVTEPGQRAALEVLRSGQIAGGALVSRFEQAFGDLIGRPHVVATSDMSSALTLALHLSGVRPGDEVATLAFSCMSSNAPIANAGASPVWVDIDPRTAGMSTSDLLRAIGPRTKAVTMYHVAGYPGPADAVAAICRERGIAFIEDCNNALGASVEGSPVGRHGDFAVYSFYPNRQLNALEGGALVCPDAATAERARRLRRFGIDAPRFRDARGEIDPASDIPEIGWSAAFSQLNAAVGLAHLPELAPRLARQREVAARLHDGLSGLAGIASVTPPPGATGTYWGFLLLAERRDALLQTLKSAGIAASMLHQRNDGYSGFATPAQRALPGTDAFADRMLALPCGWWLDDEQVLRLLDVVRAFCRRPL